MFNIINKLKNRKGFTLIELIVVLAVLAIIMAIAVPRFLGVQETAKVSADYSTGGMIAKAAELYVAQNEDDNVLGGDLDDDDVTAILSTLDVTFQSSKIKDVTVDKNNITINVSTEGSITVEVGSGSSEYEIYPGTDDLTD
jgi:type IV pilus assembly protein PilA